MKQSGKPLCVNCRGEGEWVDNNAIELYGRMSVKHRCDVETLGATREDCKGLDRCERYWNDVTSELLTSSETKGGSE
jgi:hypothetical protein